MSLRLLGLIFILCPYLACGEMFSAASVSSSSCVASAVDASRRMFAAQEIFMKCYKDCTKTIFSSTTSSGPSVPDFISNFANLAKSSGMALCSKMCFDKLSGEVIPAHTVSQPFSVYDKIAQTLLKCATDEVNDAFFAADLAQFNIDNLNQVTAFADPRKRRLFSIFYPDHLQSFWAGMKQYDQSFKKCGDIILSMRASLSAYTNNLNLCQHWCLVSLAGPPVSATGQHVDLFGLLSTVSRCQHSCFYLFRFDSSPSKSLLHPVSEIYHYLQYCLWHTGNVQESYKHAAAYSLLEPSDTSLYDYYVGGGKVAKEDFKPIPEAIYLKDQLRALAEILKVSEDVKSGIVAGAATVVGHVLESFKAHEPSAQIVEADSGTCDASSADCITKKMLRVVGNFSGIDNHRRFVVDDLLDRTECSKLVQMNNRAGKNGDGFPNTKKHGSPYTDYETYVGLGAHRLAELAANGIVLPEEVLLFFSVSETALQKTKELFGLKELYFYYVHLVCRESLKLMGEVTTTRSPANDPSHPIHADNCAIQDNGDCLYTDPLLVPRNFSAVIYLNDDFTGGEFFFAHRPNKTEDRKVNPRCGRMVLFHAGEFHGVRAVTQGTRCALAMWFTMDKSKEETARSDAFRVVSQLAELKAAIPAEPVGPDVVGRTF